MVSTDNKLDDILTTYVVDSRDLIEAMEYWQEKFDSLEVNSEDWVEAEEALEELEDFCKDFQGCGDWEYGETLIHEDYFTEYAEELVKDCGYLPQEVPEWIEIDWEATAENIKADYVEANGYYMRA